MSSSRLYLCLLIVWLVFVSGCARLPSTAVTPIKAKTLTELESYLLKHSADVDQFKLRGPFNVEEHEDREIRLPSGERIFADLFLARHTEKAPLVIFLHGLDSSKDDHAYQAAHVASWGMHALTVQLPNQGPWVNNGRVLARTVDLIHASPEVIDARIDARKIILVGHSFGAAAVSVALGEGAFALGGVLLDPAAENRAMPGFLGRIRNPVIVLGADTRLTRTRNRNWFYQYVRSGIGEVSIKDANHEDAQYPSSSGQATEESQIAFVAALTAAALSLAATGRFDYAWASFDGALKDGKLFGARKK